MLLLVAIVLCVGACAYTAVSGGSFFDVFKNRSTAGEAGETVMDAPQSEGDDTNANGVVITDTGIRVGASGFQTKESKNSEAEYIGGAVGVPLDTGADSAQEAQTGSSEPEESAGTGETGITAAEGSNEYNITLPEGDDSVTLAFAGDVLFAQGYAILDSIQKNGGSVAGVIDSTMLSEMQGADLCMVNNEFPYTTEGTPTAGKTWTFKADPSSASYLTDMGVDLVTIGNNHIFDYGETGLYNTLSTLENMGMPYVGAGRNLEEASRTLYYTTNTGIRLAFVSGCDIEGQDPPLTQGATESQCGVFRTRDDSLLCQRITEAKDSGAYVIVYMHWGIESTTELNDMQKQQASDIANAGASLIIGDHPHCLQEISYVNGVPIIYSMGNFLFNSKTVDTGLLEATFNADGFVSWKFCPAIQENSMLTTATGEEKTRILNYLQSLSPEVVIDTEGNIRSN